MRKITPLAIAASILLIGGLSYTGYTTSSGKAGPTSGSPASNNQTCSQCHNGGSLTGQTIEITTDIPSNGFTENTDYNITITSKSNGGLGSKMGFNSTVESNGFAGTVSAQNNRTQVLSNAVTHTSGSNTPSNGENSWTYTWNSGNTQTATIYAAGLFANGNGTTSGDAVLSTTLAVQKSTMNVEENATSQLSVYPNPARSLMHVDGELTSPGFASIEIYNVTGELVLVEQLDNNGSQFRTNLDVSMLSAGTYTLQVRTNQKVSTLKFIKL